MNAPKLKWQNSNSVRPTPSQKGVLDKTETNAQKTVNWNTSFAFGAHIVSTHIDKATGKFTEDKPNDSNARYISINGVAAIRYFVSQIHWMCRSYDKVFADVKMVFRFLFHIYFLMPCEQNLKNVRRKREAERKGNEKWHTQSHIVCNKKYIDTRKSRFNKCVSLFLSFSVFLFPTFCVLFSSLRFVCAVCLCGQSTSKKRKNLTPSPKRFSLSWI